MDYRPCRRTNYALSRLYTIPVVDLARYGLSRAKDFGIWRLRYNEWLHFYWKQSYSFLPAFSMVVHSIGEHLLLGLHLPSVLQ